MSERRFTMRLENGKAVLDPRYMAGSTADIVEHLAKLEENAEELEYRAEVAERAVKSLAIKYIAKLGYLPEDVSILAGEITVPEFLRQAEKELKAEVKEKNAEIKKETAREILEPLYKATCGDIFNEVELSGNDIKLLAKKYGVEIEEGWQCPKCGAILSPDKEYCPFCIPQTPFVITCGMPNCKSIMTSATSIEDISKKEKLK